MIGGSITKIRIWPGLVVAVCSISIGCRSVSGIELEGKWVAKKPLDSSLPSELQSSSPHLDLETDGSFVAVDFPGLLGAPPSNAHRDGGSGRWSIISIDGSQQLQLIFTKSTNKKVGLPYGAHLDLAGHLSSTELYYFIGDPDEGVMVSLQKE